MTPEERTRVLEAIIASTYGSTRSPLAICPTEWMRGREALGADARSEWERMDPQAKLLTWIAAPDSDYEFARDHTFLKGQL